MTPNEFAFYSKTGDIIRMEEVLELMDCENYTLIDRTKFDDKVITTQWSGVWHHGGFIHTIIHDHTEYASLGTYLEGYDNIDSAKLGHERNVRDFENSRLNREIL